MKIIRKALIVFVVLSAFAIAKSHAQIYVSIRPQPPREMVVINRPPRPSERHVWIPEEWTTGRGHYIYHPAHWTLAPYPGAAWVPGRWYHEDRRGDRFIPGHWAK